MQGAQRREGVCVSASVADCPNPEFREMRLDIWAVTDFAKCARNLGQIWRTAVFRERFVVRSRRRTDGYTHSPLVAGQHGTGY